MPKHEPEIAVRLLEHERSLWQQAARRVLPPHVLEEQAQEIAASIEAFARAKFGLTI